MKPSIEVLERMDHIVVHVRQEWDKSSVAETTLVMNDDGAEELLSKLSNVVSRRRQQRPVVPREEPERWYKIEARNRDRRGPVVAYGRGRSEEGARKTTVLAHLHEAEVTIMRMPEDFEPPAERK
jgi:hypothetical protein